MGNKIRPIGKELLGAAFLAGITALFYWRVLWGGETFVFVDASRFFYPLWKWGAAVWKSGVLPLWNPDAQFGAPYFADPQMACAYPPVALLYSFLAPTNAFAALVILHHFWALLGFWFLARSLGFSLGTSLGGCLVFGFSLHLVCSSWTPVALMAISWMPWVFLAAEKVYGKKKSGFLALSFAWAMQLSAGYPVLVYLTGLALGLHFAWKSFSKRDGGKRRPSLEWVPPVGGAALTALAYNLVWGLPFAGFFQQSNYGDGSGKFQALSFSDLATALSPFVKGHPLEAGYHGPHYWVSTFFVGLPPLCLLFWGLRKGVFRRASMGLGLLFLVLSLGENMGLATVLKKIIPGYSLVVHSGFWISLLVLWVALLSMESLEAFTAIKRTKESGIHWALWVGAIYGASFFLSEPLHLFAFIFSFLFSLGSFWMSAGTGRKLLLGAAFLLSLGPSAYGLNILLDRSYYDQPPSSLAPLSKPGRFFFTPPLLAQSSRLRGRDMEDAYETAKQDLYPNWPLAYGREEAPIYNTLQDRDSFAWTFLAFQRSAAHSRKVLDYLGVRYLFGKNSFKDFKPIQVDKEFQAEISENPSPFQKWFSVREAFAAGPSLEGDFERADLSSMDYGKECWIGDPNHAGRYEPRKVLEGSRGANFVRLSALGMGKALLASSETNDPGWKARVEGRKKTVEWINHAFRGVLLEDGETQVVFSYEPESFRLGLFLALLVCGFWGGLLLKGGLP